MVVDNRVHVHEFTLVPWSKGRGSVTHKQTFPVSLVNFLFTRHVLVALPILLQLWQQLFPPQSVTFLTPSGEQEACPDCLSFCLGCNSSSSDGRSFAQSESGMCEALTDKISCLPLLKKKGVKKVGFSEKNVQDCYICY